VTLAPAPPVPGMLTEGGVIAIGVVVAFVGVAIIVSLLVWKHYMSNRHKETKYMKASAATVASPVESGFKDREISSKE